MSSANSVAPAMSTRFSHASSASARAPSSARATARPSWTTLSRFAHSRGLLLHVDGARLANAAAGLSVPLRALTSDVGVDAVSFGGTKNGLLVGEAVVFCDPAHAEGFAYLRKQTLQLASKGRFLAAQFIALLEGDLWRRSAAHANAMADRLAAALQDMAGVRLTQPVQANGVFAVLPAGVAERLQPDWHFYTWDPATGEVRLMCSWDTTSDEVDAFAADLARACQRCSGAQMTDSTRGPKSSAELRTDVHNVRRPDADDGGMGMSAFMDRSYRIAPAERSVVCDGVIDREDNVALGEALAWRREQLGREGLEDAGAVLELRALMTLDDLLVAVRDTGPDATVTLKRDQAQTALPDRGRICRRSRRRQLPAARGARPDRAPADDQRPADGPLLRIRRCRGRGARAAARRLRAPRARTPVRQGSRHASARRWI